MRLLILDGGLGTTLEGPPYNVRFTDSTPLWSSHLLTSDPRTLTKVHRAFVDAGADIVLTATYQTSIEGFQKTDPSFTPDNAKKYMRSAVQLARDAGTARIALSLGPYGATMTPIATEYTGQYPPEMDSEDALRKWHADRLAVFASDRATWDAIDFVAFETVKRVDEVRAIRDVVHSFESYGIQKPWWITGVFPTQEVDEPAVREWVRAALLI